MYVQLTININTPITLFLTITILPVFYSKWALYNHGERLR